MPKTAVLIPAYNEEETIGGVVSSVKKAVGKECRILVINDGSSDRTEEAAKRAGARVFSHFVNMGLAETFRTGIERVLETDADIVVHIDADGQYRASEIPKLVNVVESGEADLVLGSRFLGTIEEMPYLKKWGNRAFSRVISRITGARITDGQTGFRAFTREFAKSVKIRSKHTYTQEMIIRAVREKFRIKEVPVYFAKRSSGSSRLMSNPFGYAARAWVNILRIYRDYEPLKFFGYVGVVLMLIGFIFGAWGGIYKPLVEGIPLDMVIPTILMALLFLVSGLQILLFGFLADREQ